MARRKSLGDLISQLQDHHKKGQALAKQLAQATKGGKYESANAPLPKHGVFPAGGYGVMPKGKPRPKGK